MRKKVHLTFIPLLLIILLFNTTGCTNKMKYDKNAFIGYNSNEIAMKYGDFDIVTDGPQGDGLYCHCKCGYISRETQKDNFGTIPPEYFMIYFDENGIAYKCEYEQGRVGG